MDIQDYIDELFKLATELKKSYIKEAEYCTRFITIIRKLDDEIGDNCTKTAKELLEEGMKIVEQYEGCN